jgi:hypothetical protein
MSAPSIAVGGGGAGSKDQQHQQRQPHVEGKRPLSETIGKMAEESRQQSDHEDASEASRQVIGNPTRGSPQHATVLRERRSDEPPNPKKRTWEENEEVTQQEERVRDEL